MQLIVFACQKILQIFKTSFKKFSNMCNLNQEGPNVHPVPWNVLKLFWPTCWYCVSPIKLKCFEKCCFLEESKQKLIIIGKISTCRILNSAPSTSRLKRSILGFPSAMRMLYKGKHWILIVLWLMARFLKFCILYFENWLTSLING